MAYSSFSHKTHKDFKNPSEPKERDWLELGLGFSSNSSTDHELKDQSNPFPSVSACVASSSSSPHVDHQQRKETGLGLKVFDNKCVRENIIDVAPPTNYHRLRWQEKDDANYEMMLSWPSAAGRFLGLHDDQEDDWQMPVPNDSHHYFSTTTPTPTPHPGLWFTLQSSTNREGEGLPQIPKAYIRVKDENVTVFMVKKYLVTKLGLSNEAEIDVWCMGQNLSHTQTLKQVRDSVWLPRLLESVNFMTLSFQNISQVSHLMSLQYGRPSVFN